MAIQWEEKDLVDAHGKAYEEYRRKVPMLIPQLFKKALRNQESQSLRMSA
jgi:hypothetical protein